MSDSQLSFGVAIPFANHLGMELHGFADGHSEIRLPNKPELLNSFAVTHGGVLMTMLDIAMATAARSVCAELGVVTIEMKTSFMLPAIPGKDGPLVAKGALMQRTATLAFTQATVYDSRGRACAHATGTFKYLKRLTTEAGSRQAVQIPTD
jgi:uncharacterized protein (TIGR00369 family)